jgi:hypothetical protein
MSKRRDPNPSPRRRKPAAPRRSTWPIFRAYTPIPDAFRVSGYGTAGIVRVQPNGKLSSAFFMLNLSGSGVDLMFGKDDETPDTVEALLRAGYRDLPPWQEGPADLAARYVWGAHALTQDEVDYPDEARRYLDMLPKFPGRRRQWRVSQMFAMHPPIASEELLIAIDDLVLIHGETPSHQEVAVATFMELEVADLAAVREAIRLRPEDFEQRDSSTPDLFVWIKPRTRFPEERAGHGLIELRESSVWAHAPTLSTASQLVTIVSALSNGSSRLIGVD